MTALTHLYCDYCNRERDKPEGDDGAHFAVTGFGEWPQGWWVVPKLLGDHPGHACPPCVIEHHDEIIAMRSADLARVLGEHPGKPPAPTPASEETG